MKIVIACSRPGYIRGGQRHPASATYELHHFTPEQLREIVADPAFGVVVGNQLTPENVDEFLDAVEAHDEDEAHDEAARAAYDAAASAAYDRAASADTAPDAPPVVHEPDVDQGLHSEAASAAGQATPADLTPPKGATHAAKLRAKAT